MTGEDSVTLPNDLLAPARARAWITAHAGAIDDVVLDDALLVASELVTNAVRHGLPDVVLTLRRSRDVLRIEVEDAGGRMPAAADTVPGSDRASGRGLVIVAATARGWGVAANRHGPGKTVWAELAIAPGG